VQRILKCLASIPGVISAVRLSDEQRLEAVEQESRLERASDIPVRNVGMRLIAERRECFALLKDSTFRSPRAPTVYLVEEDAPINSAHILVVDGRCYAVVGEEVCNGRGPYSEAAVPLDDSFVIFPERRQSPDTPCVFLLPPIPFPELEKEAPRLGICDIVSVSPSLAVDTLIRSSFGFPLTNELATLLIGCNITQR
jgi:hypothetical protein